ncbi:hypothetical protein N9I66_06855 [Pseudomonadales bacterium]|jgi:hypothetical protein|nr:hypothetical protein [Pseudomonadales bacterium]MDC1313892.1 hypothetical protein [Pseudomonadales bacterium]
MTIKRRGTTSALKRLAYAQLLAIGLSLTHAIHAAPASSAMSGFEPLIGGQWVLGSTYQTYTWGPDRQSVFGESFVIQNGEKALGAKGLWYFDPASKTIKGVFVATNMPFTVLHYRSHFEAGTLISQVTSLNNLGTENHYQETIRVTQPDAYLWELTEAEPAGNTMKAEFHRAP